MTSAADLPSVFLLFPAGTGDHVGIGAVDQNFQQRCAACPVDIVPQFQAVFQHGQAMMQDHGKSGFDLPANPGDAVLRIELLPSRDRIFSGNVRKILLGQSLRHRRNFLQHTRRVAPLRPIQTPQCRTSDADGENSAFVRVHTVGGIQHLALRFTAQWAKRCKCFWCGAVHRFTTDFGTGLKVGIERCCTAHKGKGVHVRVASAVAAVHKARFGRGGHFIEQGPDGLLCGGGRIPSGGAPGVRGHPACPKVKLQQP